MLLTLEIARVVTRFTPTLEFNRSGLKKAPHAGCFPGTVHSGIFVKEEIKKFQVRNVSPEVVRRDQDETAIFQAAFRVMDLALEDFGCDGAFVDVEQGDIVIGDLVQQDDEFDQIRVGLLPEWFPSLSKQVVQQRSDTVGQCIGVEIVVKRIVTVLGLEADFDIVARASAPFENAFHLAAEVPFHLQNKSADLALLVCRLIGKNLLRKRVHAATCLSTADCAEDSDACE